MKKVHLIVPEDEVIPVTEGLAASDVFYLARPEEMTTACLACDTGEWRAWANTFAELERRVLSVMESLEIDEGPRPTETPHLIAPEVAEMDVRHLEQETVSPVHELEEMERHLAQLQRYVTQLQPLVGLDVDLGSLRDLRYTFVMLGQMPLANIERLQSSLEHTPHVLTVLQREERLATVVLFGLQLDAEILLRATRSAYLNPLTPPENYRGTPAEALKALQAGIERTERHIEEQEEVIAHLREIRIRHLRLLLWRLRASRTLVEAISNYGRLHYTYVISGWVPDSQLARFQEEITAISPQTMIEVGPPRPEDEGRVPVVQPSGPFLLEAFQGLVTNYGYPRYGEMDPTPLLAFTFPLIFGIMFGDVGHGLLLALLGWLLASRKVPALESFASLGPIIAACGVASMLFGFLYGSIFGFEELLEPLWLQPLENITDVLLATVFVGVGILSLGMVYNVINAALARQWGDLLFDHHGVTGLIFYWSLLGLAASVFAGPLPLSRDLLLVVVLLSGLTLTFSGILERLIEGQRPLVEEGLFTYLMQALFELFETLISFLSNTLSYVRMGAFAVAHGALSVVVFILAELVSPGEGVGYWIVVALGNLFVIGFEGMIVSIQTLRLEYYEFFSKFFSGSGEYRAPLSLVTPSEEAATPGL
jgi:V/A-type H+-transporting ATPase subunit I